MTRTTILVQIVGTIAISLFIATRLGSAILDPQFLIPIACLSVLFVGPLVTRTRKLIPSVLFAFGIIAISLSISIGLIGVGTPDLATILKAAAISLIATTAAGALTLFLLSKIKSASTVKWIMRALMLGLYLIYRYAPINFG
jgi:hypothetical protein